MADIEQAFKELEAEYLRDRKAREQQYLRDRESLENTRDVARRLGGMNPVSQQNGGAQPSAAKFVSQQRNNRDLVRAVTLQMPDEFTLRHVLDKAKASTDEQIRNLDEGTFHATFHWFKKHSLIEVVREGQGQGQGTVYRLASKDLRRPPIVSKRNLEFPLKDMVLEAVAAWPASTFGKKDIFRKIQEIHPEHANRVKEDVVSALLHRLSSPQFNKIRCIEKGVQGNVYERFPHQPQKG